MFVSMISFSVLLFQMASTPTPTPLPSVESEFASFVWFGTGGILGVVIGVLLGLVIASAFRGAAKQPAAYAALNLPPPVLEPPKRQEAPTALRCPVCNSIYTDASLKYCLSDGTALVRADGQQDPSATMVYPEKRKDLPPTIPSGSR